MIKKCGDEWCVYNTDGTKMLGKHATEDKAIEQLSAIEASKTAKHSLNINDVEVFAAGVHNGDKYTVDDLHDIVNNTKSIDFLPAIKIGHTNSSDLPAYGYAENPRVVGDKIKVDFTSMPEEVYNAIKEKRFGRVSSEILIGASRNGKKFNKILGAVALLGQAIPGVAGLKPLYQMFSLDSEKTLCFDTELTTNLQDGGVKNLSDNLEDQMADDVKKFTEQIDALKTEVAKFQAMQADYDFSKKQVAELKQKVFEAEVSEKTKGIPSSLKPLITALYHFTQEDVKTYSVKLDGQEESVSMSEAIDKLSAFLTLKFSHLFKEEGTHSEHKKTFESVNDEVDSKIKEYMAKNKESTYSKAMDAVLSADTDLKKRYAEDNG